MLFESLQLPLSCITRAVLQGRAYHPKPDPHAASFPESVAVGRRSEFMLDVLHLYRLVDGAKNRGSWRAATVGYFYTLRDHQGRGVLAYHWHPNGPSPVTHPHLHVGGRTTPIDLRKAHLPTGQVSLVAVVRMAIAELGVAPLRPDWQAVLDRAEPGPRG